MRLFSKCDRCRKTRWFTMKRSYRDKHIGPITSMSEMCGKCHRKMKKLLKSM